MCLLAKISKLNIVLDYALSSEESEQYKGLGLLSVGLPRG
jgi:hypothetical protein